MSVYRLRLTDKTVKSDNYYRYIYTEYLRQQAKLLARWTAAARRRVNERRAAWIRRQGAGELRLKCQGGLVQIGVRKVPFPGDFPAPVAKRGKVTELSSKSRKRLLDQLVTIDWSKMQYKPKFITLTYPSDYPTARQSKRHFVMFSKRLERIFAALGVAVGQCWKLEFQDRGAPHYHIMLFNSPYLPFDLVRWHWGEVIGYAKPFVRIEAVQSRRGVVKYMAKYLAKDQQTSCPPPPAGFKEDGGGQPLFNNVPYLSAGEKDHERRLKKVRVRRGLALLDKLPGSAAGLARYEAKVANMPGVSHEVAPPPVDTPGRFWGWRGKQNVPFASENLLAVPLDDTAMQALLQFKRYMRSRWSGVRPMTEGATLYVDNSRRWLDLFLDCLGAAWTGSGVGVLAQ